MQELHRQHIAEEKAREAQTGQIHQKELMEKDTCNFSGGLSRIEVEITTEYDGVDFLVHYIDKSGRMVWKEKVK